MEKEKKEKTERGFSKIQTISSAFSRTSIQEEIEIPFEIQKSISETVRETFNLFQETTPLPLPNLPDNLEVYFEDFVNIFVRALVQELNANIPDDLEDTVNQRPSKAKIVLKRQGKLSTREDRVKVLDQYTPNGPVEFILEITLKGFKWKLLVIEVKNPITINKTASITQALLEGLACCSKNSRTEMDIHRCDVLSETCYVCGADDCDDCSCSSTDQEAEEAEILSAHLSPHIPSYAALTDFNKWKLWKISTLEGERDEEFSITPITLNHQPILDNSKINYTELDKIFTCFYSVILDSLNKLSDFQNGSFE